MDAGKQAFARFSSLQGTSEIMELALASLESVRRFATAFINKHNRLDALVNNAGRVAPEGKTKDGFELSFGTNHLGHFLLTELLLDILRASAPSRIICLSSVVHVGNRNRVAEIHFNDLNYEKRPYSAMGAYAQSKLANLLHAKELAHRLEGTGVTSVSVHPGWIRSNFGSSVILGWARGIMTPHEGAQTTLHCLLDDDVPKHNGEYYSQNSVLYPNRENRPGGWPMSSPNPNAHDKKQAERLYEASLEMVGLASN